MAKRKSPFTLLKQNKVPLKSDERRVVMSKKAVWHHGPGGKPSPAVWKSKSPKTGIVTYVTNTHRAFHSSSSIRGAISKYHRVVKGTA